MAVIEHFELRAVILSMLYFFFLFGSYSVIKPVRDAIGTVYGVEHYQELFTATFLASLVFAPLYSGLASRIRLATFLPCVYGFIAASILLFFVLFRGVSDPGQLHWVSAAFYVWVSTFNILIISVFWSFMADLFSRTQAKRLFGFVAAGGTIGGIVGPFIARFLGKSVGNNGLMIIAAAGFIVTAVLVRVLAAEKARLAASGSEAQQTTLERKLSGGLLDGFVLLLRSPYLLLLALFLLLMTWVSTIVYVQLGDLISKAFESADERTSAYAGIEASTAWRSCCSGLARVG
jgi:AAA family ATP:ADP antiporter